MYRYYRHPVLHVGIELSDMLFQEILSRLLRIAATVRGVNIRNGEFPARGEVIAYSEAIHVEVLRRNL